MFSHLVKQSASRNGLRSLMRIENSAIVRLISISNNQQNSDLMTNKQKKAAIDTNKYQQKMKKLSRSLVTVNHSVPVAANATAVSKEEAQEFMNVFTDLVRDLTDKAKKYDAKDASKWFAKALQYNVPGGKKNRGLATVLAYKSLANPADLSAENIKLAHYLGWCVEMLQSHFLICDDIMDGSETRRNQACWYKVKEVGMTAINDALMIESGIYHLLKLHFGKLDCYVKLIELFHEATFITCVGQSLDMAAANKEVSKFTMERYKAIVAHKTAFYTFYLPVALSMSLAGYSDPEVFRQAKTILLEMGNFFQVQDDFLDCFGDPEVTGKVGTDIQDNKCSWLAVVFMQRASRAQKEIMKDCYGSSDIEKVNRVKQLYEEIGLPHTYTLYEEESYKMIKTHIQQTSRGVPHDIFFKILDKIYRRDS